MVKYCAIIVCVLFCTTTVLAGRTWGPGGRDYGGKGYGRRGKGKGGYPVGVCPRNEFYTCGSACQTECRTFGEPCLIENVRCNDGCYCIDGYARLDNGTCVPDDSSECEVLKPGRTRIKIGSNFFGKSKITHLPSSICQPKFTREFHPNFN